MSSATDPPPGNTSAGNPSAGNPHELLIQSVMDYGIYMLGTDGRVMSWGPGAERIKGYTAAEIIGEHFSRFYLDDDRAAGLPAEALRVAAETGRFAIEGWRRRKDGSRFWAMVVIDAIHREGELVGFAKITRDITEQHNAQMAALDSERRFRLLVQSVTDYAICMLSPDGYITNWNIGAERIKGYTASEIVGQHFSRFYTREDIDRGAPAHALETARREGSFKAEGWRCRKDGSRFWASVVIDAVYDDQHALIGFAKITRDLTERRETQSQLEQAREQLFQLQKMEAVGQLTGGIAHDFNNLLTGIIGGLEMVQRRVAQGRMDDISRFLVSARGAADRAATLIHRLLAFSRRQTLDPKAINLNVLVADMADLIRRTMGPAIAVEVVQAAGLWATMVDINATENVILNLCINARDAMPAGGRLVIETSNRHLEADDARARDLPAGAYVFICISDTGTGMTPEVAANAFDPFFTTKPLGTGTGLGLSMVYGFARQSGGQAWIRSEIGMGTTVCLSLPRHAGDVADARQIPGAADTPRADRSETVLVVDDEPTVRMLVTEVLGELGYLTITVPDGASALKVLQSDTALDLLVTDVGLPGGINGRQVAEAGRKIRPALKVLFITGYAENAVLSHTHLAPGMHLMTKPFEMHMLASRIKTILIGE